MLPRLAAVFFAFGGLVVAERSPLFEELRYRDMSGDSAVPNSIVGFERPGGPNLGHHRPHPERFSTSSIASSMLSVEVTSTLSKEASSTLSKKASSTSREEVSSAPSEKSSSSPISGKESGTVTPANSKSSGKLSSTNAQSISKPTHSSTIQHISTPSHGHNHHHPLPHPHPHPSSSSSPSPSPQPIIPHFSLHLTLKNNHYYLTSTGKIQPSVSSAAILFLASSQLHNVNGGYVSANPKVDPYSVVLATTHDDYEFSTEFSFRGVYSGGRGNEKRDDEGNLRHDPDSGTESFVLQWKNKVFGEPDGLARFCVSGEYVYAVLVNAPIPESCIPVDLDIVEVEYVIPLKAEKLSDPLPSDDPYPPPLSLCPPGKGLHPFTKTIGAREL